MSELDWVRAEIDSIGLELAVTAVAIQGEAGSFSHAAALDTFGPAVQLVPCPTFDDLFGAVESDRASRGVVPIENALAGSVYEAYDALGAHALHVVGETWLPVRHCLAVRPGTALSDVRRVASHPVALAQCRRFFAEHPAVTAVPAYDTTGSVRDLMADHFSADGSGAIGSAFAARLYGAQVLLEGIEDHPENQTRFLIVARDPGPAEQPSTTLLVFTLPDTPGSLYKALGAFAERGLNLSKIESRPVPGRPWEYAFYLDVVSDSAATAAAALTELRHLARDLRILGAYPARALPS